MGLVTVPCRPCPPDAVAPGYAIAALASRVQRYGPLDHGPRCLVCQWPTIAAALLDPPIHPTCHPEHAALVAAAALAQARVAVTAAT